MKKQSEKQSENIVIDGESARLEAMKYRTKFAKVRWSIDQLKEHNAKIYWDILWDCLKTGNLQENYAKRFAEENFIDWSEVEERNKARKKFVYLADITEQYPFGQNFLIRSEDGSFDLDHERIDQHFIDLHTYTFTDAQLKAVEAIVNAMNELEITPYHVTKVFVYPDVRNPNKVAPNMIALGKYYKARKN